MNGKMKIREKIFHLLAQYVLKQEQKRKFCEPLRIPCCRTGKTFNVFSVSFFMQNAASFHRYILL